MRRIFVAVATGLIAVALAAGAHGRAGQSHPSGGKPAAVTTMGCSVRGATCGGSEWG
jgi:hypothetical protein